MKQSFKRRWLFIFATLLFLSGCDFNNVLDTDFKSITTSPTIAIPLGYGTLSIQDFLSDADSTNIKIYQGGADNDVIYLAYEQTLKTQGIRDLLVIPDKNVTRGLTINPTAFPIPLLANQTITLDPGNITFDLDFDPEKFDEILFTQGTLQITAQTDPVIPNLQFEGTITLPTFTKDGVPLDQTLQTGAATQNISIAGYKGQFDNNIFEAAVVVTVRSAATPSAIPPGTRFNVTLDFNSLNFDYIRGFFGEQTTDLPDETLEIGAFENIFDEVEVSLASPRISFVVINEYGIPVTVIFNSLEARNSTGTLPVTLNPTSPITAAFPTILGDSALTTVTVTNAKALLDFAPTEFFYSVSANINEGLTDGNNFCKNDSELSVRMSVEVPFIGHASNIVISDTLDIDLSDLTESEIESASIKINAINELPIDASLQLYLLDANFLVLDSLLNPTNDLNKIIVGSDTDLAGTPTTPGVYNEEIEISSAKINKLFGAKKILIASRLQTADNPKDVKFRSTDKLSVKLGLKAKVKLNVDL